MAFTNALGRVSRHGQWRLRREVRASGADGRLDLTDDGLIDFGNASEVALTVTPRPPYRGWPHCEAPVLLSASMTDGTLSVINPGWIEAVFLDGWSAAVPAGRYDVRIRVTIGPETAILFDEPVEIA